MSIHATSLLSLEELQDRSVLSSIQTQTLKNLLPSRSESLVTLGSHLQDIKARIKTLQRNAERISFAMVGSNVSESERDRARNFLHLNARLDGLLTQLDEVRAVLDRLESTSKF